MGNVAEPRSVLADVETAPQRHVKWAVADMVLVRDKEAWIEVQMGYEQRAVLGGFTPMDAWS